MKEIYCKLCAWKFEDESLYEIHMSFVHEQLDEFEPDIQTNVNKYVNSLLNEEKSTESQSHHDKSILTDSP